MRFGLFLNTQLLPLESQRLALEGLERQVWRARAEGFEVVLAGQHFLAEPYGMFSPLPLLARLSAYSRDMHLGIGIALAAMAHPVQLAEEAATLDVLAGGRFILGVGLGYRDIEFDSFRIPRGKRASTFEENIVAISDLLAGKEVHLESAGASLKGAKLSLLGPEPRKPPLWIAANNDKGISRAARLGDAWLINPHARLSTLVEQVRFYRSSLESHGKANVSPPLIREAFVADTASQARELARPFLEKKYQTYLQWGQDRAMPSGDSLAANFDRLAEDRFLIGSPADVADEVRRYEAELDVNTLIFRVQWPGMPHAPAERSIQLLGTVLREIRSGR